MISNHGNKRTVIYTDNMAPVEVNTINSFYFYLKFCTE